jgi:hypothetical protein
VFIQTLISFVYRDLLLKEILDTFTEINHFFREVYFNKLYFQYLKQLKMNIIDIICKLKMIFPLFFFNSIEHLPIHLVYEEKVRGHVQYK